MKMLTKTAPRGVNLAILHLLLHEEITELEIEKNFNTNLDLDPE